MNMYVYIHGNHIFYEPSKTLNVPLPGKLGIGYLIVGSYPLVNVYITMENTIFNG